MKTNRMTKKMESIIKIIGQAFAMTLLVLSSAVFALDLQTAKSEGLVGETESGYLEVVGSNADAKSLAESVNTQRRAQYERIARQNDISVSDVETLAGKKAIEKTTSGQMVKIAGKWIKK